MTHGQVVFAHAVPDRTDCPQSQNSVHLLLLNRKDTNQGVALSQAVIANLEQIALEPEIPLPRCSVYSLKLMRLTKQRGMQEAEQQAETA